MRRSVNAIRLNGVDAEMLTLRELQDLEPMLNVNCRFPIEGGAVQWRGGISRHDAVVWGFARAAGALGVDIIQGCEVTGFWIEDGRVLGVKTTLGEFAAPGVCIGVAGHSSVLAQKAGFTLPIHSTCLQAMVTEPVKPLIDTVLVSATIHVYVSQTGRGEVVIGGADVFNSYAQRGGLPVLEANAQAAVELFPCLSRLRVMRQWAGTVDITPGHEPDHGHDADRGALRDRGLGHRSLRGDSRGRGDDGLDHRERKATRVDRAVRPEPLRIRHARRRGRRVRSRALMGFRLDNGGHVDRSQPIHFRWNGRRLSAFAGDTIASALLANDIAIVGRGMKLHRPRGVLSIGLRGAERAGHPRGAAPSSSPRHAPR